MSSLSDYIIIIQGDDIMGRFDGHRIGLREKETNRLITAYPYNVAGTDEEIIKRVRDWFYQTSCSAEDQLLKIGRAHV